MLKRLSIRNFQCHEHLDVKFDPQITAIIGPSDTGKSAIIRALRWLAFNRPLGSGFIRNGTDDCRVKLRVDKTDVVRRRGKAINNYSINPIGDGSGSTAEAFGTDVPESVQNLLNLGPENFSLQHDPPFWFSLTPGEVAKQLNKIVDLDVIDTVVTDLAGRHRKSKAQKEVICDRLKESEEEKKRLEFVPTLLGQLDDLERLDSDRTDLLARRNDVVGVVAKIKSENKRFKTASKIVEAGRLVLVLGDEAKTFGDELDSLRDLLDRTNAAVESAEVSVPDISELEQLWERMEELTADRDGLNELLSKIRRQEVDGQKTADQLEEAVIELKEQSGGICPICGRPLEGE